MSRKDFLEQITAEAQAARDETARRLLAKQKKQRQALEEVEEAATKQAEEQAEEEMRLKSLRAQTNEWWQKIQPERILQEIKQACGKGRIISLVGESGESGESLLVDMNPGNFCHKKELYLDGLPLSTGFTPPYLGEDRTVSYGANISIAVVTRDVTNEKTGSPGIKKSGTTIIVRGGIAPLDSVSDGYSSKSHDVRIDAQDECLENKLTSALVAAWGHREWTDVRRIFTPSLPEAF